MQNNLYKTCQNCFGTWNNVFLEVLFNKVGTSSLKRNRRHFCILVHSLYFEHKQYVNFSTNRFYQEQTVWFGLRPQSIDQSNYQLISHFFAESFHASQVIAIDISYWSEIYLKALRKHQVYEARSSAMVSVKVLRKYLPLIFLSLYSVNI